MKNKSPWSQETVGIDEAEVFGSHFFNLVLCSNGRRAGRAGQCVGKSALSTAIPCILKVSNKQIGMEIYILDEGKKWL